MGSSEDPSFVNVDEIGLVYYGLKYNPISNQLHYYAHNTGIYGLTYPLLLLFLLRQLHISKRMVAYALSRTHPGQRLLV
jgi:hypothetical protein